MAIYLLLSLFRPVIVILAMISKQKWEIVSTNWKKKKIQCVCIAHTEYTFIHFYSNTHAKKCLFFFSTCYLKKILSMAWINIFFRFSLKTSKHYFYKMRTEFYWPILEKQKMKKQMTRKAKKKNEKKNSAKEIIESFGSKTFLVLTLK